jgi:hypothetical protein
MFITDNALLVVDCDSIHEVLLPRLETIYRLTGEFVANECIAGAQQLCDEFNECLRVCKNICVCRMAIVTC